MDDILIMFSGRIRAGMQAFMFLDVPERVETFGLLSFSCSLGGSLGTNFPTAVNLAIALLALVAARSRSDAQLLGLCVFVGCTILTDLMQLFHCSAWAGAMLMFNAVLKFGAATNAYRMVGAGGYGDDDANSGRGLPPAAPYQAPLGADDYASLAAEAASKHVGIGDATNYRAI